MRRVAIDIETATNDGASICQIAIVEIANPPKVAFAGLIRPPDNRYDIGPVNVHRINSGMTRGLPTLEDYWPSLQAIMQDALIVAHNISFDKNVLEKALAHYKLEMPNCTWECTYQATGLKLDKACERFDIHFGNAHDAAYDALATAELYLKLNPDLVPKTTLYHEALSGDVLRKDLSNANPDSFFYDKKVVFTGLLRSLERKKAAKIVKELGADIDSGVTRRTHYVICGDNVGPRKMEQIEEYNIKGSNIVKIYEDEFIEILRNENKSDN